MINEKIFLSHEPVYMPWAFNIHGHQHEANNIKDRYHLNICGDARKDYTPINLNVLLKNGIASQIENIHHIEKLLIKL